MNMYEEGRTVIHVFKGGCLGIVLYQRGANDKHICFAPIVEDDGNWFMSTSGASTSWFDDLLKQMDLAYNWMESDDSVEKYQWGYRLK